MNNETKNMIKSWIAKDGGDAEKTARWMSRVLKIAGIKKCRELIADATK